MNNIKTVSATEARNNFFELITQSYKQAQPVLVEKNGLPLIYLIPVTYQNQTEESSYQKKLETITGKWFCLSDWEKIRRGIEKRLS